MPENRYSSKYFNGPEVIFSLQRIYKDTYWWCPLSTFEVNGMIFAPVSRANSF